MLRNCLKFRRCSQALQLVLAMASFSANAQISRAPANFVPDDDQIIVPMVIERNFVDDFHEKHKNDFKDAKKKIRTWTAQEAYAEAYGLQDTGTVDLPTAEEKQKFFERNYLRYITKDFERGANKTAQDWYENWNTDDELAAIDAQDEREKYLLKAKKKTGRPVKDIKKEVKVGKSKIRLDIQPRLEIGMVKMRFRSPYFDGEAWVGVNGNQELEIERKFKSTGTRARVLYFIEQKRMLASVDQHLMKGLSLRLTHDKVEADGIENATGKFFENNVVQIRFGMGF